MRSVGKRVFINCVSTAVANTLPTNHPRANVQAASTANEERAKETRLTSFGSLWLATPVSALLLSTAPWVRQRSRR
ncbi:MAG: hypothetical protein ACK5YU_09005 [Burkholderiales bacterium]